MAGSDNRQQNVDRGSHAGMRQRVQVFRILRRHCGRRTVGHAHLVPRHLRRERRVQSDGHLRVRVDF